MFKDKNRKTIERGLDQHLEDEPEDLTFVNPCGNTMKDLYPEDDFENYHGDDYEDWQPTITVYCSTCQDHYDEKSVEFRDIAEDMQGRDVLTFRCRYCGEIKKSLRRG